MKTISPNSTTAKIISNYHKATVVEFVGPPGAGKTTSCNCFAEMLQAKGLNICRSSDLKAYIRNLNTLEKLQLYFNSILLNSLTLLQFSLVLARHKILSFNSIYRYLRLTIFQVALRQMVNAKKIDLVLLDQWMIQELWSATIFKTKAFEQLHPELKKFYFKTDYLFYFDLDLEKAADRIAKRSHGRSRFDRMRPKKRLSKLKKYTAYLHQLYQNADCREKHTLSTEHSPHENGELLLKLLAPLLNSVLLIYC
jgi:thymidylate kinase